MADFLLALSIAPEFFNRWWRLCANQVQLQFWKNFIFTISNNSEVVSFLTHPCLISWPIGVVSLHKVGTLLLLPDWVLLRDDQAQRAHHSIKAEMIKACHMRVATHASHDDPADEFKSSSFEKTTRLCQLYKIIQRNCNATRSRINYASLWEVLWSPILEMMQELPSLII